MSGRRGEGGGGEGLAQHANQATLNGTNESVLITLTGFCPWCQPPLNSACSVLEGSGSILLGEFFSFFEKAYYLFLVTMHI